jgi:hypothetical protein
MYCCTSQKLRRSVKGKWQEFWPLKRHRSAITGRQILATYVGRQSVAVTATVDLHLTLQSGGDEAGGELVRHGDAGRRIDDKKLQVSRLRVRRDAKMMNLIMLYLGWEGKNPLRHSLCVSFGEGWWGRRGGR